MLEEKHTETDVRENHWMEVGAYRWAWSRLQGGYFDLSLKG